MHIFMLTWEYPPRIVGGISRVVYNLTKELAAKGDKVSVFTCMDEGLDDVEKNDGITVYRVKAYNIHSNTFTDWVMNMNFAMIEKAVGTGEADRADIIHAHDWLAAYAARVLKYSFRIPLVSTIHATEHGRNWGIYNDMQRYINSIEWWLTYESWRVIVNSRFMKDHVSGIFSLPRDKIDIVNNAIDCEKFRGFGKDMPFRRNYAMDDEKIVFYVGRMVNEKGVQVLLDAVPAVLARYGKAKFVLAGKGPMLDYLRDKAWRMGISDKVYFTGYMDDEDLRKLYGCIDVAVVPSLYEPFGITALEGMAAGVPTIVSDCGGLAEIVEHGTDGFKFRTGSAQSLAKCVIEILENPGDAEFISNNALEKARKEFNWQVAADKTRDVYDRVLKEREETDWHN